MVDLFGVPLSVGDKVAYTTGGQGDDSFAIGEILELTTKTNWRGTFDIAYAKSESGRRMTNPRYSYGLVSLNPIKAQHPELFV